jgi:hypothetical protein
MVRAFAAAVPSGRTLRSKGVRPARSGRNVTARGGPPVHAASLDRLLPRDGRPLSPRLIPALLVNIPPGDIPVLETTVSISAPDPALPADASPARWRISADWAAVTVAAVLVLLAVLHLLPTIPFLVK